MKSGLL